MGTCGVRFRLGGRNVADSGLVRTVSLAVVLLVFLNPWNEEEDWK